MVMTMDVNDLEQFKLELYFLFLEHIYFGTFNRPDAFDANGSTIAHFAAQRENPAPLFRCLKDLGTPLARTNKVRIQNKPSNKPEKNKAQWTKNRAD